MAEKLTFDVEGQEVITTALVDLLNSYPGLNGDVIAYATLGEKGKAIFPTSGSAIRMQEEDVTGHVEQTCEYPFILIYRASGLTETRKERAKEWLDNVGRWLERQEVIIGGETYKLTEYPKLTRGRRFESVRRSTTAFLDSTNENGAENWAVNITATYVNEFDK